MKLTFVLQALRMGFLPRSNSAKLVPGMGGKDVDSMIGISRYLIKYQQVIKVVEIILSGKSGCVVECRCISPTIGILTAFPWRIPDCCHWENRKRALCILTCSMYRLFPAGS